MKSIAFLSIFFVLFSCNKDSNTFKLEGDALGFADGTEIHVYVVENNQPKVIDTLIVTEGKFSAEYAKTEEESLNFLRPNGTNGTVIYFPENEDMKVTLYKDSIYSSTVSGGKQNESYAGFSKKMVEFKKVKESKIELFKQASQKQDTQTIAALKAENIGLVAEENAYKTKYVKENTNSLFSLMLLSEMLNRKEITPSEATEIVNGLNPKMASSDLAVQLKSSLEMLQKAEIGSLAPDFSAPTPTGGTMSLKDAMGKYTIIDFWASWCRPCRVENPNVVNVYNKYHDKGLNIISVSLDKADGKEKWIQAIKDDKMDWHHVSNLQFWQDPIAQMYNVRSIPATFLLDENGNIIDKNLRGPALEAKIASLLGEN